LPDATAQGVLLNAAGEPIAVEELALEGPGPNEVQVRLTATGVCHTDLHVIETGGWGMPLPVLLGHEGVAVVEELGDGVEGLARGDHVVLAWRAPCGECRACSRGDPRRCRSPLRARRRIRRARDDARVTQALLCGTFATRTNVHAGAAVKVPAELPPEEACLLGCAVATGVGSVLNTSRPWPNANVAVIGCGAVGLSVVQGARLVDAERIVAVDLEPRKLEWARELGATDTVDASAHDAVEAVLELTGGEGVDFAYEAVGRPETVEQSVRILAHAGTATLIGVPKPDARVSFALAAELFDKRATIRLSHGGDHLPAEDFPLLAGLALEGRLDLRTMVTQTIGLDEVGGALEALRRGETIRSVVLFDAE
jgi:S-(hydroxymethyl)mycothiol dehydrogenase